MRFPRTPTGSRSTVLDRLDAQRASRARSDEETVFLEQIIFTGRPVVVAEEGSKKDEAPQKVKVKPAEPEKKSKDKAQASNASAQSSNALPQPVQNNESSKAKLSPFETELLAAWSQD